MELRYINVNGYGVLVDETAAPQEGDIVCGGLGGNDIIVNTLLTIGLKLFLQKKNSI